MPWVIALHRVRHCGADVIVAHARSISDLRPLLHNYLFIIRTREVINRDANVIRIVGCCPIAAYKRGRRSCSCPSKLFAHARA